MSGGVPPPATRVPIPVERILLVRLHGPVSTRHPKSGRVLNNILVEGWGKSQGGIEFGHRRRGVP